MASAKSKRLSTRGKLVAIAAIFAIGTAVTSLQKWSETHAFMINATDSLPNWAFLVESGRFPERGDYVIFHPGYDEVTKKGSVAKIVKLEHAWRRLDGRNDDGFQVAPFPG